MMKRLLWNKIELEDSCSYVEYTTTSTDLKRDGAPYTYEDWRDVNDAGTSASSRWKEELNCAAG